MQNFHRYIIGDEAMSKDNGDFVAELLAKKDELSKLVAAKKSELAYFDNDNKKLGQLLDSEKHSKSKDNKNKKHGPDKNIRTDIQKNEAKFNEQSQKITSMRRELQHLENELKSINHDLNIVKKSA